MAQFYAKQCVIAMFFLEAKTNVDTIAGGGRRQTGSFCPKN
jgi:hypothetical protein